MDYKYFAVAEDAEDGSWSAYVPDLPGCTAGGSSAEEALDNVQISVELWLAEAKSAGAPVPLPKTHVRQIAAAI